MYKRYVDDAYIVMDRLTPCMRWIEEEKKLRLISETIDKDMQTPTDVRTARQIKKLADTISGSIQWEEAVPSNKKLPILDLQCWMEKVHGTNKVYYEFYRKPMSNRLLMLSQSAMP